MSAPLVLTESLGGSPLAARLIAGTAPATWCTPRPASGEWWAARVDAVTREFSGGAWLSHIESAFGEMKEPTARERLRRAASNGVVVTTGQQPGLFGGPMYTWHKALTALAMADALERLTGIPAAPVFWAATDDADFEEACWTAVAIPGGVEKLRVGAPDGDGVPMAWTPLGDASEAVHKLRLAAGSATDTGPLDAVERAYANSATVGSAYLALLRALLEPLGIAVLDAGHEAVRRAAGPVTLLALERAAEVETALATRARELAAEGLETQVADVPGLSLVFAYQGKSKQRIPVEASRERAGALSASELGATVLLRPVVERAILPTVAYVAGPAETAYFAQTSAVADALGLAQPLAVPRWSGTIVEAHIAKLLDKHRLTVDDVRAGHTAENRVARGATPPETVAALAGARSDLVASLSALQRAAAGLLEPAVVEGARKNIEHRLDRLERRLRAAVKRRETALMSEIGTLTGALAPLGKRQERVLNILPTLARNGDPLLRALREATARHAGALIGVPAAAGVGSERRQA